jgi:ketosteroid isomerase-like protein
MQKLKLLPLLLLFTISCTQKPDLTQTTKAFYTAMNAHDHPLIASFYADSIRIIGDGYQTIYSKEAYKDWVEWDAVFEPTYEILSLEQKGDTVIAQISKSDVRIRFLNGAPYLTTEQLLFDNGKLQSLRVLEEDYDMQRWLDTRALLVNWIAEHHPQLNGFIFDQSKQGGENYLKAIKLYQDSNQ